MVVFEGEYGEVFSGIGYNFEAVSAPGPTATTTAGGHDTAAGTEDHARSPVFVAAQQQQQQLQRDAVLARSKAQDILRNILSGIDEKKSGSGESRPVSTEDDYPTNFNGSGQNNVRTTNGSYDYYGPQETEPTDTATAGESTGTAAPPWGSSPAMLPAPTPSSIESDARVARQRAMDILRGFQSRSNGSVGVGGAASDGRGGSANEPPSTTTTPAPVLSSISNHGPQVHHQSAGTGSHGVLPIPPPLSTPPPQQQQQHQQPMPQPSLSQPQQLQPMIPATVVSTTVVPTTVVSTTVVPPTVVPEVTTPPWELARRRRECLEKEEERKQRAMYKNLQYVARLEEERLTKQLEEVRQVKTLEQQIDESYRKKLEYRQLKRRRNNNDGSNTINTSGAGIGTKQRRKAEAKRQKAALPPSLQRQQQHRGRNADTGPNGNSSSNNNNFGRGGGGSVAIYVSNLPTDDGSGGDDDGTTATIEALFGAYGTLRKVHFYVDKRTGRKKGDALVIYSLSEGQDEAELTESVCSQVGTDRSSLEYQ